MNRTAISSSEIQIRLNTEGRFPPRHVGVGPRLADNDSPSFRRSVLPSQQRDLLLMIMPAEHQICAAVDDGALGRLGTRESPPV